MHLRACGRAGVLATGRTRGDGRCVGQKSHDHTYLVPLLADGVQRPLTDLLNTLTDLSQPLGTLGGLDGAQSEDEGGEKESFGDAHLLREIDDRWIPRRYILDRRLLLHVIRDYCA